METIYITELRLAEKIFFSYSIRLKVIAERILFFFIFE